MALQWLRALRRSFDELVRVPETPQDREAASESVPSWPLLWFTLRFHLLVSYALLVVRVLGPYHRLNPPANCVGFLTSLRRRQASYDTVNLNDIP